MRARAANGDEGAGAGGGKVCGGGASMMAPNQPTKVTKRAALGGAETELNLVMMRELGGGEGGVVVFDNLEGCVRGLRRRRPSDDGDWGGRFVYLNQSWVRIRFFGTFVNF